MATFAELKNVSRLVKNIRLADQKENQAITEGEREEAEEAVRVAETAFAAYLSTLHTGG